MYETIFIPCLIQRPELENEIVNSKLHPKLLGIVFDLGYWLFQVRKNRLVISSIFRSDAKQSGLYKDENYRPNIHGQWRAIDVFPNKFEAGLMKDMEIYVNSRYPYYGSPGLNTALFHDIGAGAHIHLQVGPNEPFSFARWGEVI